MKPKTKNTKPVSLKREPIKNETPAPPLADVSAALPSAAKQQKQKKLMLTKLKRAAKMTPAPPHYQPQQQQKPQLQKKKQKKQKQLQNLQQPKQEVPPQPQPQKQQQQPKKRKMPVEEAEKRPRVDDTVGGANGANAPGGGFLSDTGPVRDPVLRAEIAACLRRRAASTVRLRRLPNRLRLQQVSSLCQGIQAARIPWNYATGRNKGVAFLEFASPEDAKRAAVELDANKSLGTRLTASIRDSDAAAAAAGPDEDDDVNVDIDVYNCRRVVVCSLHPSTTGQELKDLVGGSAVLRVDFLHGSKMLRKHAPAVAFLTFADERRALDAVNSFQGRVVRGRGTSWMLQKRSDRPEHTRHRTQLVAFGVSKRVTDEDILKAFPNSQSMDVRQNHGMAIINYANEADCRADFDTCKGGIARIGKAKLRVQFGHSQHKPVEQRRAFGAAVAAAASSAHPERQPPPPQQQQPRKQPQAPPKPLNIDPSLFNKSQLIVKNFKPATQEADIVGFLTGVRRVFFTPNRRLAFVHFHGETAAAAALEKLAKEPLDGAHLKAMFAMDKPDKKIVHDNNRQQQHEEQKKQEPEAMDEDDVQQQQQKKMPIGGGKKQKQQQQKKKMPMIKKKAMAGAVAKPKAQRLHSA